MGILSNVISYLKKENKEQLAPEGICPNCWGHQEYEGQLYELMRIKKIDSNNVHEKQAFIQEFVTTHLDGITLQRQSDKMVCSTCNYTS